MNQTAQLTPKSSILKTLGKIFLWAMGLLVGLSILIVVVFRWVPVLATPLMVLRGVEYILKGEQMPLRKDWVPLSEISMHLQKAVIASEDPKFLNHHGFDFEAIEKAIKRNKTRKRKLGASTISQQTAKNVFLYPSRTYFRKGLEAYFTVLIELLWGKERILEVYLNVIELGPGLYGAEAASQKFWKKKALHLTASEAQLLAAILPNPRRWNPTRPTSFVLRRKNFARRNMQILGPEYFKELVE